MKIFGLIVVLAVGQKFAAAQCGSSLPGACIAEQDSLYNVGLGNPTQQSSLYNADGTANHGVDGNPNPNWTGKSCTHTLEDANSWWAVDLGAVKQVGAVGILNRQDCCSTRLANFHIGVTNDDPATTAPSESNMRICATHSGPQAELWTEYSCGSLIDGRYVVVQLKESNFLTLCEVLVFGRDGNMRALSLGQPTWQSSLYPTGVPDRAVDGNYNPNWSGASCTHTEEAAQSWWAVDLGGSMEVHAVNIVNRADCCSDRLSDFNIGVTDSAPNTVAPAPSNYKMCLSVDGAQTTTQMQYDCTKPTVGRYVVIQLRGKNFLTLCEVTVIGWDALENCAVNKPATQSSTYNSYADADHGSDGDTNQMWLGQSCTHTNQDPNSWWYVDLEAPMEVLAVTLYNRKDCCAERLANINIGVSWELVVPSVNPLNYLICAQQDGQQPNSIQTYECREKLVGQYVIVQLRSQNYLTLCEVEVMAVPGEVKELAAGKTTWQSSIAYGGSSSRGVDGNLNADYFVGSCTHTETTLHAWWSVDLGAEKEVISVAITNRQDCCSSRLSDFYIGVSHTAPSNQAPTVPPNYNVCHEHAGAQAAGVTSVYQCGYTMTGRYVIVQLKGTNYLTLCEVQVYGRD